MEGGEEATNPADRSRIFCMRVCDCFLFMGSRGSVRVSEARQGFAGFAEECIVFIKFRRQPLFVDGGCHSNDIMGRISVLRLRTSIAFRSLRSDATPCRRGVHKCDTASISRRFVLWIGRRPRLDSDDHVIVVCLS